MKITDMKDVEMYLLIFRSALIFLVAKEFKKDNKFWENIALLILLLYLIFFSKIVEWMR